MMGVLSVALVLHIVGAGRTTFSVSGLFCVNIPCDGDVLDWTDVLSAFPCSGLGMAPGRAQAGRTGRYYGPVVLPTMQAPAAGCVGGRV